MLISIPIKKNASGFSLVEIMVGIALGLLGVLVIMQVSSIFEGQKRTTTGGSDAQTTGSLAFYTMSRDLRRAGFGLSEPGVIGCTVKRSLNNNPTPSAVLAPVTIVKGVGGLPDQIRLVASSKGNWSIPINLAKDHPQNATEAYVNTALGMEVNDILIAYQPDDSTKNCAMFQISGPLNSDNKLAVGTDLRVEHVHISTEIGRWNPDDPTTIFPVGGYTNKALVFNFGTMIDHTYSVDANGNLVLTDAAAGAQPIASDVVTIKAQYGFDTRAGPWPPIDSPRIAAADWRDAMIDADGDGAIGDAGDLQRIVAVRIVLVARSPLVEKPNATSRACDVTISTATSTRPANAPTWVGGAIDVSKNPDGSANPNWQCYRYKTFEDTIPFRNLMWRNS